ncbi:MAG: 3-hydroxyacyl-ACP dehydratase FabZ family protein [Dehalococcoidia bacterium]
MSEWTAIDRVIRLEAGKSAQGIRNVPNTLSILDSHFPRFPVLPGVLILGSLGELAGMLLAEETQRRWRLASAQQVRFRHFVQPGDQMELTVEVKSLSDTEGIFSGTAKVEGKLMVTARQLRLVSVGNGKSV